MSTERFYVKINRDDGSRSYKGAWTKARCEREADAWRESFPTYDVTLVTVTEGRADVRAWSRATRDGGRYFPPVTHDTTVDHLGKILR